jgi:hypothetical protein
LSQFYITDPESARIATEAIGGQWPISVSGTIGNKVGFFTGQVQSVEEDLSATPKRWRVTILDGN